MSLTRNEPAPVIVHTCKHINYEYNFLAIVNSMEELDDFRFKHHCDLFNAKRFSQRTTLCCTKSKARATRCQYKLLVIRPNIGEKEYEMHMYAYGEHNHAVKPESERLSQRHGHNIFLPDQDPPPTQRTADGLEWIFLRTIDNFEAVKKCRIENCCTTSPQWNAGANRHRLSCLRYRTKEDCPFSMLAMKTTKWRYHIYTNGQHNHAITSRSRKDGKSGKRRTGSIGDDPESESSKKSREMEDAERKVDDEQEERMEEEGEEAENAAPPVVKEYSLEKIQRRLGNSLRKGQAERAHKWMGRVDMEQIDDILTGMDLENVLNLMEMADRELNEDRESRNFWRPWIKGTRQNHCSKLAKIPGLIDRFTSRYLRRKLAKTINEEEEDNGGDNKQ